LARSCAAVAAALCCANYFFRWRKSSAVATRISKESIYHSSLLLVLSVLFNLVEFCYDHTEFYQEIH
jgi:hypothetical protein